MPRAKSLPAAIWPLSTSVERERRIAEIADDQWTMISLPQLIELGLSDRAVRHRAACGRLHRQYRGVYSVGHQVIPWQGHIMAAVLACREGAVASHLSAARLHGLVSGTRGFHVTVPGRRVRVPGIVVHQGARLEPWRITREQRIPCTSWARTIVDVAGADGRRACERMIDRAEQLRIFDLTEIQREIGSQPSRKGARIVRELSGWQSSGITRNDLEERLLEICEGAGLPQPHANYVIVLDDGGAHIEADFAWPQLKLVVETDGWETHGTRRAFAGDRRRDRRLALAGWRVIRFTWHEVEHEPERVARELGLLVAREG